MGGRVSSCWSDAPHPAASSGLAGGAGLNGVGGEGGGHRCGRALAVPRHKLERFAEGPRWGSSGGPGGDARLGSDERGLRNRGRERRQAAAPVRRRTVGLQYPSGRDRAAWGSPARCGLSGFPVAVGPAVGARTGTCGCRRPCGTGRRADRAPASAVRSGDPIGRSGQRSGGRFPGQGFVSPSGRRSGLAGSREYLPCRSASARPAGLRCSGRFRGGMNIGSA